MASDRQVGGRAMRVLKTGIALVHEGELILPSAGSAAEGELVDEDSRSSVVYRFPVEIEVRSGSQQVDIDAIVNETLHRLAQELDSHVG